MTMLAERGRFRWQRQHAGEKTHAYQAQTYAPSNATAGQHVCVSAGGGGWLSPWCGSSLLDVTVASCSSDSLHSKICIFRYTRGTSSWL